MIVHLNGELIDADSARIGVFDRGFLLGDGIYEGLRAIGGHVADLDRHCARMRDGLRVASPAQGAQGPREEEEPEQSMTRADGQVVRTARAAAEEALGGLDRRADEGHEERVLRGAQSVPPANRRAPGYCLEA